MKIGIYGGSFNPVHKGHIQAAEYAQMSLGLDRLFFVPTFQSPFKTKMRYASPIDRVAMLELVKPIKSEVSLFEINRQGVSYTIDTVRYFRQHYPRAEIFLLIGDDNVDKLHKWSHIEEVAQLTRITVLRRHDAIRHPNLIRFNCLTLDNDPFDFASTRFREGILEQVDQRVMRYIADQMLYVPDIMTSMLDAKRHKHSIAVGELAVELAKKVGFDRKQAWFAGAMHDITKCWTIEHHRQFLVAHGVDESNVADFELHSLTGYLWLRDDYGLQNQTILDAVLRHTALASQLTMLDKIIFAADKLATGRRFASIQTVRTLIQTDFEAGFKATVKAYRQELISANKISSEREDYLLRWV